MEETRRASCPFAYSRHELETKCLRQSSAYFNIDRIFLAVDKQRDRL
jgi:hypothetical protein